MNRRNTFVFHIAARRPRPVVSTGGSAGFWRMAIAMAASLGAFPVDADMTRGATSYFSAQNCASAGKLPAEVCNFADMNSAAEFDEKAPRFASRDICERSYGSCSLGFRGADGWAGRKNAIFFSPRRQGFRITVKSEHDVTVVPTNAGMNFSPRSALRRDASINPRSAREQTGPVAPAGGGQSGAFGVPTAEGMRGPLPPRPPVDPNFDCAAVLEPTDKGDPSTGCVLAPPNRR